MIAVIDSGVANLASVMAALQRLGADARVTADPKVLAAADRIVFPGVGAAGAAMARLKAKGLDAAVRAATQPVMGICLGMQLLFALSEENGGTPGLGLFPGSVRRLPETVTVPHMGWNTLTVEQKHPLLDGVTDEAFVYFVHSYAADTCASTLAACTHGRTFAAVVGAGNFFGCQFHPERSGAVGARLLQNFLSL
jgi:glutamine amidotransferase